MVSEGSQTVLLLAYGNGRVAPLAVTTNRGGSGILLNGKRYLTQASPMCP
ncbi:hypothetical protein [Spirosoma fluminis]